MCKTSSYYQQNHKTLIKRYNSVTLSWLNKLFTHYYNELLNAELIEEWNRFLERVNGDLIKLDEDLKFLYKKEADE